MIKKENFIKIVLIIVIFSNLFLVFRYCKIQNSFNKVKLECAEKEQNYHYNFQRDLELVSQKIYIRKDSIFNKKMSLTPKLIFVYSGNECEKCIFGNIEKVKDIFEEGINKVLIILPILENNRNTRISLEANLNGLSYKRLDPESIQIPKFNNSSPLFFAILLPNGDIILPFFPDSGNDVRTDAYLRFVVEKYL